MRRESWTGPLLMLILVGVCTSLAGAATVYNPTLSSGSYNVIADFEDGGTMADFPGTFGTGNFYASTASIIGDYSAATNTPSNASGPGYAALTTVNVIDGQQYVLSAFFRPGTITTGGLYIDQSDIAGEVQIALDTSSSETQFVYDTFTANFTGILILRLVRDSDRFAGEAGYIDDVGFTLLNNFTAPDAVAVVPLPPAAYAGLALLGVLGGIQLNSRRRMKLA